MGPWLLMEAEQWIPIWYQWCVTAPFHPFSLPLSVQGMGRELRHLSVPTRLRTLPLFSLQFWLPEDKIQLRRTLNFPIFERKSCYVAHTNLNLIILLPPLPKCWGYRCAPIPFPTLFSSQTRLCFSHLFFLSYVYCHGRRQAMTEPHVAFSKTFLYTAFYFLVVLLWYKS